MCGASETSFTFATFAAVVIPTCAVAESLPPSSAVAEAVLSTVAAAVEDPTL